MWIDQRGSEILSHAECERLLASAAKQGAVGRIAVAADNGQAPLVQPVNFAFEQRQVLLRLGDGHMAEALPRSPVAFEVDQVDAQSSVCWSVLVRGFAIGVAGGETGVPVSGVEPRPLVPEPGDRLFVLRPDVITGRRFKLSKAC